MQTSAFLVASSSVFSPGREALRLLPLNGAIGMFMALLTGAPLVANLIFAQCIGYSILLVVLGSQRLRAAPQPEPLDGLLGVTLGGGGLCTGHLGQWLHPGRVG